MPDLMTFQRTFVAGATRPGVRTAALSLPRGNGKSWLAGRLVTRALTPDDDLFVEGGESVLCAASIEQARIVFRFARADLEPLGGYRFLDSSTRCAITHVPTNTRLRVVGSNGRTTMGLVNCPLAVCDEPGAWEINGGRVLHDAIQTAQGKPDSSLRAVYIGTLSPLGLPGHWWHDMIADGSRGSVYVQALQGNAERWDRWPEIRRVNPLMARFAESREVLREERDNARRDSRLKARFSSFRLNVPSVDESEVLLTVDDYERIASRAVAPRDGRPVVGVDLGAGRAWSAAVAIWRTGRVEALAIAPGIPNLEAQEKRDRIPAGVYRALAQSGALTVATGLRVQPPASLVAAVRRTWGRPANVVCDRLRLPELRDSMDAELPGVPAVARVSRWSESNFDIRTLRKCAADGPFSVAEGSRDLLAASLSAAMVKPDDAGNVRLVKKSSNNEARDDVAAALVLAAGSWQRASAKPRPRARYRGLAG